MHGSDVHGCRRRSDDVVSSALALNRQDRSGFTDLWRKRCDLDTPETAPIRARIRHVASCDDPIRCRCRFANSPSVSRDEHAGTPGTAGGARVGTLPLRIARRGRLESRTDTVSELEQWHNAKLRRVKGGMGIIPDRYADIMGLGKCRSSCARDSCGIADCGRAGAGREG